jgi:hypothetical protein
MKTGRLACLLEKKRIVLNFVFFMKNAKLNADFKMSTKSNCCF